MTVEQGTMSSEEKGKATGEDGGSGKPQTAPQPQTQPQTQAKSGAGVKPQSPAPAPPAQGANSPPVPPPKPSHSKRQSQPPPEPPVQVGGGDGGREEDEEEDCPTRVIDLDTAEDDRLLDTQWLLQQSYRRHYVFNVLCVGETGIGKSTLMDTLFNTSFEASPATHDLPGVKLKSHTYELQESNVKLKLTTVDSVGFGDQIDKTDSYKAIVDYIDAQFEVYLQEELKVKRALHTYHDTRIHACLYFIAPTGHSLKSLDLVTMKALDSKVNIIPVIAKADTITKQELHKFKIKIMSELVSNGVQIYQFPTDDETVADINSTMNGHLPFAVVGSMDEVKVGNKMVKARQYPWGTVQVENENHCDFVKLREMLIRTNMEDLRETTHFRHYELYRRCKLQEMGFSDDESMSLQETYEHKRSTHLAELQKKEEEMRQMFVVRVKEKETELKDHEKELHIKFDALKKQHAEEKKKLEEHKRTLEEEINLFNKRKAAAVIAQQQAQQAATMGKKGKK